MKRFVGAFAVVIGAILLALSSVSMGAQGEARIAGFEPEYPATSKTQTVVVSPDPPQGSQGVTGSRPPPSNARMIVSILALVISTVVVYLWARGLSKSKVQSSSVGEAKVVERRERMVLQIAMVAAAMVTLFPPFYFQGPTGSRFGLGHSFILLAPRTGESSAYYGSIDGLALLATLAGIVVAAWLSIMFFKSDD